MLLAPLPVRSVSKRRQISRNPPFEGKKNGRCNPTNYVDTVSSRRVLVPLLSSVKMIIFVEQVK